MTNFPDTIPHAEAHVWATLIPGRTPEFKVHRTEGLANSAMSQRGVYASFAKYELVDGEWKRRFLYVPRSACDRCKAPYAIHETGYSRMRNIDSTFDGPNYLAPVICNMCNREDEERRYAVLMKKRDLAELERLKAKYE